MLKRTKKSARSLRAADENLLDDAVKAAIDELDEAMPAELDAEDLGLEADDEEGLFEADDELELEGCDEVEADEDCEGELEADEDDGLFEADDEAEVEAEDDGEVEGCDEVEAGEDCEGEECVSVTDILSAADEDGNITVARLKSFIQPKAAAEPEVEADDEAEVEADEDETLIPDDKPAEAVLSSERFAKRMAARAAARKQRYAKMTRKADVNRPGIEDTIGNQMGGGAEPSVSTLGETGIPVSEARALAKRLDRIASYCQARGQKRIAYNLDLIANTLDPQ